MSILTGLAAIDAAIAAAIACPSTNTNSGCNVNMSAVAGNPALGLMGSSGGSHAGKFGMKQRRRATDIYSTSNVSGACSSWCSGPGPLTAVMYGGSS